MKLPNVFLIGAQKSGTTSVYNWLSQHPSIDGEEHMKDYPFFSENHLYSKGLEYFSNFFKSCNSNIIIAGSVHIMFYKIALERLYKNIPNARLILILRNPIDRAISSYRYAKERGLEERSLMSCISEEMIKGNNAYKDALEKNQKFYLKRGLYVQQIENIYSIFDKNNVFIGLYDDIISNKEGLMKDIFSFLDLKNDYKCVFNSKNVTKGGSRFKLLDKFIYSQRLRNNTIANRLKFILPQKYKFLLRRALKEFNRIEGPSKAIASDEERKKLYEYYSKDIVSLENLIKRDLSNWRYNC